MDLQEVSKLIMLQVQHNSECGKDDKFTIEEIEGILQRRVVNILEPQNVYEKGKFYDGFGYYIGIVDTHPYGADYFVRNHHFRIPVDGRGIPSEINKVFIREIKK